MFLLEIIVEILIYAILKYPGAIVIWVMSGFTIPFKELFQADTYITGMIGGIAIILLLNTYL